MKNNLPILKCNLFWRSICMALILILANSAYSYGVTGPGATWQYVRKITLAPVTSTANLQVKVTLAAGQYTNMNASGNDLRFYDVNNNLCNYWIETWNTSGASSIWVNVPVSGTANLYMYYGNVGASAASNGDQTFIFFDDFSGASLNATKWGSYSNGTNAAISVSGGSVTLNCGTQTGSSIHGAQIIAKTSFNVSDGVIIESALGGTANSLCGARAVTCGASEMAYTSSSFFQLDVSGQKYAAEQIGRNGQWGFPGTQGNGTSTLVYDYQTTSNSTLSSGTTMSVAFTSSNIYYYRSGTLVGTNNTTPPSGILYPILSSLRIPDCMGSSSNSVIIDYIRLRKYTSSVPAITISNQGTNNLSASISSQTNVSCNGQSNGSATVTATGGTSPYTYAWSNAQTTQAATGLSASTYTVTVTDNIGLSANAAANITQPAAVGANISSQTNVLCNGQSTGSVIIAGSGGTGAYTYALNTGTYGSSGTFSGLAAATYSVHVKDGNGCSFDQPVTITQLNAVAASINGQTNISCYGGSDGKITVSASGGTGPYQFSVHNGDNGDWVLGSNPYTFTGLQANVAYKIRVKDSNGCESPGIP